MRTRALRFAWMPRLLDGGRTFWRGRKAGRPSPRRNMAPPAKRVRRRATGNAPEMQMPTRGNPQRIGTAVELRGLEPLTPCMPCRCATSCATAPRPSWISPPREDSQNYTGDSTPLISGHHPRRAPAASRRCTPASATSARSRWCSPPIQTTRSW